MKLNLLNEAGYDSANLWWEVNALTLEQIKRTQSALDWLVDTGLQNAVVIVGGTAVAHHSGIARPLTPDIDFLVRDLQPIRRLLQQERIAYTPLEFTDDSHVGISVPIFDADFMVMTNAKLNETIFATSRVSRFGGKPFRFIAPEMLAMMKLLTGRNKDLDDAVKVLQSLPSTASFKSLVKRLRSEKLINKQQSDDVLAFAW
jgi:hypothetical protein